MKRNGGEKMFNFWQVLVLHLEELFQNKDMVPTWIYAVWRYTYCGPGVELIDYRSEASGGNNYDDHLSKIAGHNSS